MMTDTYCLNLDIYTDNSVYEIYVNGVAQSPSLNGIIPLPYPYNPINHTASDATTVSLCHNWKAGDNVLIIQVTSSATIAGMLSEVSVKTFPPPELPILSAL